MPLSGGPSDKVGNRYELRWVVRRFIDLVTGRLEWIRLEPPGEHSIEFRSHASDHEEACQVKRGLTTGHWTIRALAEVLDGFGKLLQVDTALRCCFVSEHAAPELKELSERARDARDLEEFTTRFLAAKSVAKAWLELRSLWATDEQETWRRLRMIAVTSVSESHLRADTDAILQLLFEGPPETVRAVLFEFALDSVHKELRREQVVEHLVERGIRPIQSGRSGSFAATTSAPPPSGIPRAAELGEINRLISSGKRTISIGGIAGIGKTTVAAQFAAGWKGPVCWMDCELITSALEATSAVAEFVSNVLDDGSVKSALASGRSRTEPIARLAGKLLGAKGALLIWDGMDGDTQKVLRPVIEGVAAAGGTAAQLVTAKELQGLGRTPAVGAVHVGRLDKDAVRHLLVEAYPDARVPELEAADEFTQGHPYLVNLLVGAAPTLDLKTALQSASSNTGPDSFVSQMLAHLSEGSSTLLTNLAWLGVPFSAAHLDRLGGTSGALRELADRYLVLRVGDDRYRVHELVVTLIKRSVSEADSIELHQRAALFLSGLEHQSWLEVQAALRHARASSMDEIAQKAGTALLRFATDFGYPDLAREGAESLIRNSAGAKSYFPHFILGKCARITSDLDAALDHYAHAEDCAQNAHEREIARYERASVLSNLGRDSEAELIYRELLDSTALATKVEAHTALALVLAARDDGAGALTLLDEAAAMVDGMKLPREEAEVWQAKADVLAGHDRWEEARQSIKKAHALRFAQTDRSAFDIYGWFHLFKTALGIERALRNKEGARSAAHGLWRFAVISGSLDWEVNAAEGLCLSDPNPDDPEVDGAVRRLREMGTDPARSPKLRVVALEGLVLCEWSLHRYERAIEGILDIAAIGEEHKIATPTFAHFPQHPKYDENIVGLPNGGRGLFVPSGKSMNFVVDTASRVLARRPELARYATLIRGRRPIKGRSLSKAGPKKRQKKKRRKR